MTENKENYVNNTKILKKITTCTNDLRILWQTKEQNFSSFCKCLKMAEYYTNASNCPKINKNT